MAQAPAAAPEERDAPSFEALVTRLEGIVSKLESDDVQLEAALALFEEGMALSTRGTQQLDAAERRLEILLDNDQSSPLDLDAPG